LPRDNQNSEAGILARLIQTRRDDLSRDEAEYLLSLQFDERDISRTNELREMARCEFAGRAWGTWTG